MSDWFDRNGSGHQVDVAELLDGIAAQGIRELVEKGALVSLGLTSDGGALGLTVTVDGRWRREYFRHVDELTVWLGEAIPAVEAARDAQPASSVPERGSRRRRGL